MQSMWIILYISNKYIPDVNIVNKYMPIVFLLYLAI